MICTMPYAKDPRVDAYIDALPECQQAICHEVRDLVHAADHSLPEADDAAVDAFTKIRRRSG